MNKDIEQLMRRLRRQGFKVRRAKSGHYRVTGRHGAPVTVPSTPSDCRSLANTRKYLKGIGARL